MSDEFFGGIEQIATTKHRAKATAMVENASPTEPMLTQIALGTQLCYPVKPTSDKTELRSIDARQKSTISANNNQRKDDVTNMDEKRDHLLRILNRTQKQHEGTPCVTSPITASSGEQKNVTKKHGQSISLVAETHSNDEEVAPKTTGVVLSPLAHGELRERQNDTTLSASSGLSKKGSSKQRPEHEQKKNLRKASTLECSWMAGIEFSREALQVPFDQQRILQKPETWHNPQSGVMPFPEGNIPIQLLWELGRLADEKAAAEEDPNTDNEDHIDPSPDSTPDEITEVPESTIESTQDNGLTATQISWSASPSPEPPQRPSRDHQELPPDSSFGNDAFHVVMMSNYTKATSEQQSGNHIICENNNRSKSIVPFSSTLATGLSGDPDEQMEIETEMETVVPQGIGEDAVRSTLINKSDGICLDPAAHASQPTIQVKQTPSTEKKKKHHDGSFESVFDPGSNPVGTIIADLSPSILHQTLGNQNSPKPLTDGANQQSCKTPDSLNNPALLQQPRFDSFSAKRGIDHSPSENGRQHIKRRRTKTAGFGESSPYVECIPAMQQYGTKSFRDFLDDQKPCTTSERHSAPPKSSLEGEDVTKTELNSPSLSMDVQPLVTTSPQCTRFWEKTVSYKEQSNTLPSTPCDLQDTHELRPNVAHSFLSITPAHSRPNLTGTAQQVTPRTVYQSFKAAYPEYTGGVKHFAGICAQILELDREDRMVPKWQWDDFIIRNRTDYKDYAVKCADRGRDPKPYHRFYKDIICDAIYKKQIVKSQRTLSKAFAELGIEFPAVESPIRSVKVLQKRIPSRTSLPSAFQQER